MGINMPSKTSVFLGDAMYINAMNYRQVPPKSAMRNLQLLSGLISNC